MSRSPLPQRRRQLSFNLTHDGQRFTASVGFRENGQAAELFLAASKTSSALEALARDAAITVSLALQHGVPLQMMQHAATRDESGAPASLIGAALDAMAREIAR